VQSRALLRGLVALLLASSYASACGSARLVSPSADGSEFSLPEGNFGPAAGPTPVPTPPSGWVPPPCNLETSGSFRRVLSWPGSGPW
jgi:hypothetical protein